MLYQTEPGDKRSEHGRFLDIIRVVICMACRRSRTGERTRKGVRTSIVIDDSPDIRGLVENILRPKGFEVLGGI